MSKKKVEVAEIAKPEVFSAVHAFADCTGRFAVDQLLREWGFKIYSRKHGQEAVWKLYDKFYKHSDAIKEVCFRKLEDAVDREYWYKLGLFQ
jgi:hypothetical protein